MHPRGLRLADSLHLGRAALLKHSETWRLHSQTTELGGRATKTLQWLRYLTSIQSVKHCNQVAKPPQRFGSAASKSKSLGAQPPQRVWRAKLLRVQRVQGTQPSRIQIGLGSCSSPVKSKFSIWKLCVNDQTETAIWYNLEQSAHANPRIANFDFPWKLRLTRARCIPRRCAPRTPAPGAALLNNPEPWRLLSQRTPQWLSSRTLNMKAAPAKLYSGFAS